MANQEAELVRWPVSAADERLGDAALVQRAKAGDSWAEEALYRRHAPTLLNTVARMLSDPDAAQDVVQDTFVIVLKRLGDLQEPAAFRGWLKTTAVRLVYRRYKKRRVLRFFGLAAPEVSRLSAMAKSDASPEVRAELALIDRALAKLPTEQRIAWTLRMVDGEALQDVAQQCGCSLATAKRRIRAAKDAIDAFRTNDGGVE